MSRILVTGASGFVGLPLVEHLTRGGHEVHALWHRSQPEITDGAHWHHLDLFDTHATDRLLKELGPEWLAHVAWSVEHGSFWRSPENLAWVGQSLALLRSFVATGGRRALLLGTCAEYDWTSASVPLDERSSAIRPATLYGVAKDALHRIACAYAQQEGVDLCWARLFFIYGPREQPTRLVPSVARALLRGEEVSTTSGSQRRDYMHVADVARALATVLESSVVGPVDIASGKAHRVKDLVQEIARQTGAPELVRWGAVPDRHDEPPLLIGRGRRLREEVGYEMQMDLAEGIANTVQWWREHS